MMSTTKLNAHACQFFFVIMTIIIIIHKLSRNLRASSTDLQSSHAIKWRILPVTGAIPVRVPCD